MVETTYFNLLQHLCIFLKGKLKSPWDKVSPILNNMKIVKHNLHVWISTIYSLSLLICPHCARVPRLLPARYFSIQTIIIFLELSQ